MNAQTVITRRDVYGIVVPSGEPVTIPQDSEVRLTQTLGTSLTVLYDGRLVRVAGEDADAFGLDPYAPSPIPTEGDLRERILEVLRQIYDPEIPVNIVDLGLIYRLDIEENEDGARVEIDMTLTAPGCSLGPVLSEEVKQRVEQIPEVKEATVNVVFDPPWTSDRLSETARLELGLL
ncbi:MULTISPECIES: putative Fe-S cluster assembly protein SufT [Tepidiphilus]|jgi:probable FeS assembly SUF system protein SufT|uniref:Fe-S cluster assembly protein SufT n=1 Tax=Tepidiphilus baoligensis TaxID=2698687 RepID=A0ABX1QPU6_9PROT|nr:MULTISPECIES: putative Fe-S cluster assembly protein SufT [Tepidiphilus]NMH17381.1 putative Fe-S cluster assembly protein SufT [Tepidiphilus baoligensis]